MTTVSLDTFPPKDQWDDWVDYDPSAWPRKVERHSMLIPTTCFNCEAGCGLVAYVDTKTMKIRKLEGNPYHAGSRGRNCAKGPATINQINDPGRILYPMKRSGPRGSGKFERTTWDEVLDVFAAKIRQALIEDRKDEVMYHVGRPGADGYLDRVLQSWGVDGHNSHTNVCSSSARVGYTLWTGADRPSPDHANAKFILMLSAHLETGHYFNPHAQRIIEAKTKGTKICTIDIRLSNTASMSDYWLAPWPGTEATLLLALAHVILEENLFNREFMETWVNWREFLAHKGVKDEVTFDRFIDELKKHYADSTPEAAAEECGVDADQLREIAREIGKAGTAFSSHVWRNTAAGNLGGWQVARCLEFLVVLVGAVNTKGGTHMNSHNKFVAKPFLKPPPQKVWNELLYPREYPLCYHEMSILLPHFLMEGRGKISAYFTRVYNPVWTNPDGMMWEKVLRDESLIELHAALTPVWSETAQYADYVLPMGNAAERHDLLSQETHAAKWISFRQPVLRVAKEKLGEKVEFTYEANPGEVWEEDEFWIELSWRIDPDGELGIRQYFESPYRPQEKITIDEYYQWIFENSVPGLPEEAEKHGLSPLQYMREFGAFLVEAESYDGHEKPLSDEDLAGSETKEDGTIVKDGKPIGMRSGDKACIGFGTPSKKLEIFSETMKQWGWPEQTLPGAIKSQIHRDHLDIDKGEYALVPTFRLPTLIHTRSANAKWLYELSNSNPVWMHPEDAKRIGVELGGLIRLTTRIGHFVNKVWVTEGIRPGVVACSHHLGRWRLFDDHGVDKWASSKVIREEIGEGQFRFRRVEGIGPYKSSDPDTKRIWWTDGGVHQNLTFCVQPDPVSGMQCWHQKVTITPAHAEDQYADVFVDTNKSMEAYREWMSMTKPAPEHGVDNLRRPLWFARAFKPAIETYTIS
ncbi:MAG: molybdopterin-dependent oxidoreductase [Planctomycetota bacterium]|nr:molybdopterin-dependent oxidoreductase [Planctomycetota bacterium]